MTQQPNNVSAAGVLIDERTERLQNLANHFEAGGSTLIGENMSALYAEAIRALLAAANAMATGHAAQEPVAWLAQHRVGDDPRVWSIPYTSESDAKAKADMHGGWVKPLYAAPSPAAREAGDGVRLTGKTRQTLESIASTYEINGLAEIASEIRALLREAGSQ